MLRRVFIALCMMIPFAVSALPQFTTPAGATLTDYVRRLNAPVFNYGSKATIGTNTSPYVVSGDFTGQFVESTKASGGDLHGIGSGWAAGQILCGPVAGNSTTLAWMEPFLGEGCMMQNVFGDITYSNEYDGNSGYWCHDITGSCYRSIAASTAGMYDSSGVDLLGWVSSNNHGEVTTMGNVGQSLAIYMRNPAFKPASTTPPSGWLSITSGVGGVNCSPANPYSRYKIGCSTAATVWYAYDWTQP